MKKYHYFNNQSFTLVELLVVLALVAILSVVVVMTLNPAELIKQARDSNRLSDLSTINTALNLFSADVTSGFMGTSTVVYVSIPDTSPTCANLGLPALPTSTTAWTYSCVTTTNLRNIDGTGWVPVNFQRISSNSPISQLPIDPQNTTTTGNYYTYVTGGSWMLTAIPESQKQKTELSTNPQITNYPGAIGMGNNLNLSPLFSSTGLVGYWKLDEGGGAVAADNSGYRNNGSIAVSPSWGSGKIGGGITIHGSGNVSIPDAESLNPTSSFSAAGWFNISYFSGWNVFFAKETWNGSSGWAIFTDSVNITYYHGGSPISVPVDNYITGWHHFVFTNNSGAANIFADGVLVSSSTVGFNNSSVPLYIGARHNNDGTGTTDYFSGTADEIRIYNRALSAAEVSALYNSTR